MIKSHWLTNTFLSELFCQRLIILVTYIRLPKHADNSLLGSKSKTDFAAPEVMSSLPSRNNALPNSNDDSREENKAVKIDGHPILALKELVANLYRDQNKIQTLLSSLGFALRSFNNLNQFLEITPLMSARVTDTEGGALILFKPNGQIRLEHFHCQNGQTCEELRKGLEQITHQMTVDLRSQSGESLENARMSLFLNLDEKIRRRLGKFAQIFGTPILVKNGERGRLYVFTPNPEYIWTATRRKLLQLVADQTAVAIANNELTMELRARERQDRELEIASEIQHRLLPRKCPKIRGVELAAKCKTANRVGGDYYDFIPVNYDQLSKSQEMISLPWSIVIGDVMGKGFPASLIMTTTRGMLRAEVLNRHSPAKILQHLNRVMYADLENSHRFVTLFYSEYDPQTGILSYSNAAHNPPLLWRAARQEIEPLDSAGMLLGLEPDSCYEDRQIQLFPGDTIIYYTDGFTDAANQNGDRFDEINLCKAFEWACQHNYTAQSILDYLFNQVRQFVGNSENTDDMTLVVMQIHR
jgi:sigma-B regulation protein RsbU (phosphoserine phosphatase)